MAQPFTPSLHPRAPAGAPGGIGGQFVSHTLVRSHWLPTGSKVGVTGLSGNKLAAVQAHNASLPSSAPMVSSSNVHAVKAPKWMIQSNSPPAGLSITNGYLFPTGVHQSLTGLSGTRRQAAIAHNASVPFPGVAATPAVPAAVTPPAATGTPQFNIVNGYYFPAGHVAHITSSVTGPRLAAAQAHNASLPAGAPAATPAMMTAARQAGQNAKGIVKATAPSAPAAPPAAVGPVSNFSQVGQFYFPANLRVSTAGLSGMKLAAATKHNLAVGPTAPVSYGSSPIPVKVPVGQLYSRSPAGLTQSHGFYFPTGVTVSTKGMRGPRLTAANAHNTAIATGVAPRAVPAYNPAPHVIPTPKGKTTATTYTPKVGADLRGTLDLHALASTINGTGVSRSSRGSAYGTTGDQALWDIYEAQGYHQVPEMVDPAELDKRLKNGEGWVELYRGVQASWASSNPKTPKQMADEFRDGPAHYAGFGIYGNGSYAGGPGVVFGSYAARTVPYTGPGSNSVGYNGVPKGAFKNGTPDMSHPYYNLDEWEGVVRMALRPDARVITHRALKALQTRLASGASPDYKTTFTDEGHLAAALGYDAIRVDQAGGGGVPYHVILNRSAVAVQRPSHRKKTP